MVDWFEVLETELITRVVRVRAWALAAITDEVQPVLNRLIKQVIVNSRKRRIFNVATLRRETMWSSDPQQVHVQGPDINGGQEVCTAM